MGKYNVSGKGHIPLSIAAQNGHITILDLLLKHPININRIDNANGQTALHSAVLNDHHRIVHLLLSKGASICINGGSLLHLTAETGKVELLRLLLQFDKKNRQWPYLIRADRSNNTPLHKAAKAGQVGVVQALIEHGASANIKFNTPLTDDGHSPLYLAAMGGYTDIVEMLLSNRAQVDAVATDLRRQPIHFAAESGSASTTSALIRAGAHIHASDASGSRPMEYAIEDFRSRITRDAQMTWVHDNQGWCFPNLSHQGPFMISNGI